MKTQKDPQMASVKDAGIEIQANVSLENGSTALSPQSPLVDLEFINAPKVSSESCSATVVPMISSIELAEAQWLGLTDYQTAHEFQKIVKEKIHLKELIGQIIGFESHPVMTIGRREWGSASGVNSSFSISSSESSIELRSIKILPVDRGGLRTFHNPGQLIIFPSVSLTQQKISVKDWICHLLLTTKAALKEVSPYLILSGDDGVYVGDQGKIASVGIAVQRGVSMHGVAINVCNDLDFFAQEVMCGQKQAFTSLSKLGNAISTQDLFRAWCRLFRQRFENLTN